MQIGHFSKLHTILFGPITYSPANPGEISGLEAATTRGLLTREHKNWTMKADSSKQHSRWNRRHGWTVLAALLGLALGAGAFFVLPKDSSRQVVVSTLRPVQASEVVSSERRPGFVLADIDGTLRDVSQWDGQLVVINFWATWCAPCRHEIPYFVELQALYADRGLQFVGIAIDDADSVETFSREVGMNYPRLHGQMDAMEVSKRYGNAVGGLPFTVVVDRDGSIVARKNGPFERDEIESLLLKYL